jgi:hypothetical protein
LQRRFTAVVWGGLENQTSQREPYCPNGPDGGNHREDDGREGLVGPGLGVLPETATEPRADKADEIARHRTAPLIPMGVPLVFLVDHAVPRLPEGLDPPVSIGQGCSGTSHRVCREPQGGKGREGRAPTEQESTGDQRPEEPQEPQIRATRHLGQ